MPDATLDELTEALSQSNVKTSRLSVIRALERFGFSRKKRPSLPSIERDTPERRAYREAFCADLMRLNVDRLVFIDESFCKTGMRREYGWSEVGKRVTGKRCGASWKTLSIIGAIRLGERPRMMTNRGAVNGRIFRKFVRTRLVPFIRPGDVVIMDNLNIHKMRLVRELIEAAGATPVYLPTYSPELNPIELWWAHLKRDLRLLAVDDQGALAQAIRRLRSATRLENIKAWFRFSLRHAQVNRSALYTSRSGMREGRRVCPQPAWGASPAEMGCPQPPLAMGPAEMGCRLPPRAGREAETRLPAARFGGSPQRARQPAVGAADLTPDLGPSIPT